MTTEPKRTKRREEKDVTHGVENEKLSRARKEVKAMDVGRVDANLASSNRVRAHPARKGQVEEFSVDGRR